MKFIDLPKYVPRESYSSAVDRMVNRLCKEGAILSMYQIGHVSTPGISDIDLVVVFADGACCRVDPRAGMSAKDRYLFIHNLYGVCHSDFEQAQGYSFFHNYVHLWGEQLPVYKAHTEEEAVALKQQIALEYLVKMYISTTTEKTYSIIKLRNLFLHAKGLLYDFDFLGLTSGPLYEVVKSLVEWREVWFNGDVESEDLFTEFNLLHQELAQFLSGTLNKTALYLPQNQDYRISRNIRLVPAYRFGYHHHGLTLPSTLAPLGRKYFNLQHRLNRFAFELPAVSESIPQIIERQFAWQKRMVETNSNSFPHFMPLSSSLHLL